VPLKKTELFKTVIPSKMLEFMACGRPVIVGVDGQARQIIEVANAGVYAEPENASELAAAIIRMANNPELRQQCGSNGRSHVVKHFSRKCKALHYLEVLDRVLRTTEQQRLLELKTVSG